MIRAAAALLCIVAAVRAQGPSADGPARAVVQAHAAYCHELYGDCVARANGLRDAVRSLLAEPSERSLQAARAAWVKAREPYGESEALRFRGGPIEPLEPLLNAWPVDEAYIDRVAGRPGAGIVNDRSTFVTLSAPLLVAANERGGETNISVGWHAIEFLLWGQDLDPAGPGNRPFTDFVAGSEGADRRRSYLRIVTDLLVEQLAQVRDAWAPTAPHRRAFEAEPRDSLRAMLGGAVILTAFEMAGERLAVAYETRDQEQEHSCFSDTTCADLVANQRGVAAVLAGSPGATSIVGLVRTKDADAAAHLEQCLAATAAALATIPPPFDRAFAGDDGSPGRRAMLAAMEALERQTEAITIAGRLLGFDLPLRPGN